MLANVAYTAAKTAARMAKAKNAHDTVIAACLRAQADASEIEACAKRRLSDEWNAAQERGEVATGRDGPGAGVLNGNAKATAKDTGVTRKMIHEGRALNDAERDDPGIIRRTLDKEPTKAALRKAVTKKKVSKPEPDEDESEIAEPAVLEDNLLHAISGMNENARIFNKLLKLSAFDREAVTRINTEIDGMIGKWWSVQSTLETRAVPAHSEPTDYEDSEEQAAKHFLFALDGVLDAAREAIGCIEDVSLSEDSANSLEKSSKEIITAWNEVKSAVNQRRMATPDSSVKAKPAPKKPAIKWRVKHEPAKTTYTKGCSHANDILTVGYGRPVPPERSYFADGERKDVPGHWALCGSLENMGWVQSTHDTKEAARAALRANRLAPPEPPPPLIITTPSETTAAALIDEIFFGDREQEALAA